MNESEPCRQCGRQMGADGVCLFCGWRETEHRLTGAEFMQMERDNKRERATDALTAEVCKHSLQARAQKRKARIIVATAAKYALSREQVEHIGERRAIADLEGCVKKDIAKNGTIVIGIVGTLLLFPILLQVLISVIAGLIVRWILSDRQEAKLIQQARGQA